MLATTTRASVPSPMGNVQDKTVTVCAATRRQRTTPANGTEVASWGQVLSYLTGNCHTLPVRMDLPAPHIRPALSLCLSLVIL